MSTAKDHYDMAASQLKKRLRSKIKKTAKFCYAGGSNVYLADGRCNVEDCDKRGTHNCLESLKNE